ncbi:hypothetical protein B6A10_16115, partial [Flavobacterium sp. L1I52]
YCEEESDCNGDPGGYAYESYCGCIGGNTGIDECEEEEETPPEDENPEEENSCPNICDLGYIQMADCSCIKIIDDDCKERKKSTYVPSNTINYQIGDLITFNGPFYFSDIKDVPKNLYTKMGTTTANLVNNIEIMQHGNYFEIKSLSYTWTGISTKFNGGYLGGFKDKVCSGQTSTTPSEFPINTETDYYENTGVFDNIPDDDTGQTQEENPNTPPNDCTQTCTTTKLTTSKIVSTKGEQKICSCEEVPKDPCDDIKKLLNFSSDNSTNNLKSNINLLKDSVNASVNIQEKGFEITKRLNADDTYRYEFIPSPLGSEFEIKVNTGSYHVGVFHSHPSTGVPMFSFQDLKTLIDIYDDASDSRKAEVFIGLVAKDPDGNVNVYMLKIDNIDDLRTAVNDIWDNPGYANLADEDRIKAIHKNQNETFDNSSGQIEKSFLEQFPSAGVSIYKADNSLNSFSKLTLENNEVKPNPCN